MDELSAETIAGICEHMNEDHAGAVAHYALAYGGVAGVRSARIASLDARGMDLEVETPAGARAVRVLFDRTLVNGRDARDTLIAMARTTPER